MCEKQSQETANRAGLRAKKLARLPMSLTRLVQAGILTSTKSLAAMEWLHIQIRIIRWALHSRPSTSPHHQLTISDLLTSPTYTSETKHKSTEPSNQQHRPLCLRWLVWKIQQDTHTLWLDLSNDNFGQDTHYWRVKLNSDGTATSGGFLKSWTLVRSTPKHSSRLAFSPCPVITDCPQQVLYFQLLAERI